MPRKKKFEAAGSKNARVRGTFIEHVRRDELLRRWDGCCGICGKRVNPKSFEIDHIIPASKGGCHAYWNCQPAHSVCNRLKGDLMPEQVILFRHVIDSAKKRKSRYLNYGMVHRTGKVRASSRSAAA